MTSTKVNMVLRTVYLPISLDQQLRAAAFVSQTSKNDLIRELIGMGIETLKESGDDRYSVFAPTAESRKTVSLGINDR